jgi:23S rRNA (guanosine2251-2'-O)-methyltransferase
MWIERNAAGPSMKHRNAPAKAGHRNQQRPGRGRHDAGLVRIFGIHAATAALANPRRTIRAVHATPNAAARVVLDPRRGPKEIRQVTPRDLDRMLGDNAVHQGILVEADPLPPLALGDLPEARLLLVLDQITDPHNVGAILRSAAAFAVKAVVTTARHSPEATGVLAKSASGALELVPLVVVQNLARALTEMQERGFLTVGLDSEGDTNLAETELRKPLALVLGAEGKGLRQLTRETCGVVARLDMPGDIKSLNVSNATALALYIGASRLGLMK